MDSSKAGGNVDICEQVDVYRYDAILCDGTSLQRRVPS